MSMYRSEKLDAMLSEVSANIEEIEFKLKEEYKRFIRISSEFGNFAAELVSLERKCLSPAIQDYETVAITDKLCARLGATFGPERDKCLVMEAAIAVINENGVAAAVVRN
jgi:hypothetical protein